MPAGYDAEVADLFRDLRAASGMSETDLAAQLATRLEVVQALEQGAIYALPPWPETCRVVSTYGTLLNLDVRPLLRRIYSQIEAGIVELAPKPMPDVPFMMPPQDGMRDSPSWPGHGGQRATEPFPAVPRQPPPQPRQPMPDRRPPPQPGGQAQAPQFRPQPQARPQGAPPRGVPQHQPQPQGLRVQAPQRAETLALPQPHARAPQPAAPQPAPPSQAGAPPQAAPQAKAAKKAAPAAAAKKGRRGLLKWGIALLLASAVAFGLWVWLAQPSLFGLFGSGATPSGDTAPVTNDPADPRSRKGDRLPSPASQ